MLTGLTTKVKSILFRYNAAQTPTNKSAYTHFIQNLLEVGCRDISWNRLSKAYPFDESLTPKRDTLKSILYNKISAVAFSGDTFGSKLASNVEKEIAEKLLEFAEKDCPAYFSKLDCLDIWMQLLKLFLTPESIDQGDRNLCGVVSFIQLLIYDKPQEMFAEMCSYCKFGITTSSFVNYTSSLSGEVDIVKAFMSAFKHKHSTFGYGYFPLTEDWFAAGEQFLGTSKPAAVAKWMDEFGYVGVEENTIVADEYSNEISPLHRAALGGVYSSVHQVNDEEERLNALIKAYQAGKSILLFAGMRLFQDEMPKIRSSEEIVEERKKFKFLGIYYPHWVYLEKLTIKSNCVVIGYYSWGESHTRYISKEEFKKELYGMVAAFPPGKSSQNKKEKETVSIYSKLERKIADVGPNEKERGKKRIKLSM